MGFGWRVDTAWLEAGADTMGIMVLDTKREKKLKRLGSTHESLKKPVNSRLTKGVIWG